MGADLPARCAVVVQALEGLRKQLQDTQESLHHAHTELVNVRGLVETQFLLIERLWALLGSYEHASGEPLRQRQLSESVLDAAIAQLNLQTAQMEYELLLGENYRLWKLLGVGQDARENQPDLKDDVRSPGGTR